MTALFFFQLWTQGDRYVSESIPKDTTDRPGQIHFRRRLVVIFLLVVPVVFLGRHSLVDVATARVELSMHRADYRAAESWLQVAEFIAPTDAKTAFLRARLNRHLGHQEQFAESLEKAHTAGFPAERIMLEQTLNRAMAGDLKELEQQLSALLIKGDDVSEICEAYVLGCLMSYRLADASAVLQVWLADFPKASKARFLSGRLLEHRENLNEAASEYSLASDLNHGPSAFALAGVLIEQHELESAVIQAERARELLYDPQPGNVLLARLHRMLGKLDAAEKYLSLAHESDLNSASTAWKIAGVPASDAISEVDAERAEILLARKDYGGAEKSFRLALEKSPQRWRLRNGLATALRLQGRLDEASEHLSRFREATQALDECGSLIDKLRSEPDNLDARVRVAETLLNHVSENQGIVWLQSVLQYDPSHQKAHRLLFEFYRDHASENPEFPRLSKYHEKQLYGQAATDN